MGVVYFSIIPTFEPSRYCKCWIVCFYNIKYTAEQTEELSNLVATVFDAEIAGIVSFVTGNKEFNADTWKAFQDEMNSLGLSRIEEIQLDAYRATFDN